MIDAQLLVDEEGFTLSGSCGHCDRLVDNYDKQHRVSAILRGGKGVECVLRGDIPEQWAAPLEIQKLGSGDTR